MSVILRHMGRRNCTQKDFSKESHLFFQKKNPLLVKNYSLASVLPTVSKTFERIMQKQIIDFVNQYLSLLLCKCRKAFSTQTALLYLTKKWNFVLKNKRYAVAIQMDLSKAFDTIMNFQQPHLMPMDLAKKLLN